MAKKNLRQYLVGNVTAELVWTNFPFLMFIFLLILIYIANAHNAEKKVRDIQDLTREIKEERFRYMEIQAKVMYDSKESEIAKDVEQYGLSLTNKNLPKKIVVPN